MTTSFGSLSLDMVCHPHLPSHLWLSLGSYTNQEDKGPAILSSPGLLGDPSFGDALWPVVERAMRAAAMVDFPDPGGPEIPQQRYWSS